MWYECKHCHCVYWRDSEKAWMKSYCDLMQRESRLWRVPDQRQMTLTGEWRKRSRRKT